MRIDHTQIGLPFEGGARGHNNSAECDVRVAFSDHIGSRGVRWWYQEAAHGDQEVCALQFDLEQLRRARGGMDASQ